MDFGADCAGTFEGDYDGGAWGLWRVGYDVSGVVVNNVDTQKWTRWLVRPGASFCARVKKRKEKKGESLNRP